ncbi:unnamed protein product [Schistosoma turkestanicum]|nr:unnamed protein product [Schistosoma turkestanicum]
MCEAFVTLATNDEYACGALVWGHSLRQVNTTRQIACMVTKQVSKQILDVMGSVFDHVEFVDVLDSKDETNLALLSRPDLGVTFTKLHCWRLTQYTKAVFMDADTMVLKNIDDLFEREELSAAPDPGWPDCFNSGVFVFKPSLETYKKILHFAVSCGSFDGGDQVNYSSQHCNRTPKKWLTTGDHVFRCFYRAVQSNLPSFLRIYNESHLHNRRPGGETHFRVVIVSHYFNNLSPVKRERLVYKSVENELQAGVHALSIIDS